MKTGIELIAAERQRQIDTEGWTPEHDDRHATSELARAAITYIMHSLNPGQATGWWPWDWKWFKPSPSDRRRELVKAGALIAAEIDRINRILAE